MLSQLAAEQSFLSPGHPSDGLLYVHCLPGKRKALKLNFANPPFKSTARFTLNTSGVPFQNPHM
uniref:Uncharacterized protein n=1 Tax=Accipiter nisus TaxID=211598 RepID=A0A8B9N3Q0_9AVES